MPAPRPPAALSERWFRTSPDSSVLPRPRLLARLLVDLDDLDRRIAFFEHLLGVPADLRMPIPDFGGLELAAVGNLLLIASARPFTPIQRRTAYSLIVPSLTGRLERLRATGTVVLEPPEVIVPGSRARVRHPDGSVAELVEHRPQPGELPCPPAAFTDGRAGGGVRLLARRAVPRAGFAEAVALYESVLEAKAGPGPGSPRTAGTADVGQADVGQADLGQADVGQADVGQADAGQAATARAIVGNLLLVAVDDGQAGAPTQPAYALLAPSAAGLDARLARLGAGPARAGSARAGAGSGPWTVTLPGGVPAEVWTAPAGRA
ncbi:VOC family protein [Kitasatospora sp. NPDC057223]|uniref:VOC family protein n=1 Tax=Kitasatospora sp. NPDC057223 TaxID=3346055 RepID=UPI003632F3EB